MSKVYGGITNIAGKSAESRTKVEALLKLDREKHHCYYGPVPFHNHLSHHLLAAYDLGAPSSILDAIYANEAPSLNPIDHGVKDGMPSIDANNWSQYLGQSPYYSSYLQFFTAEVNNQGQEKTLEKYVFSPEANAKGVDMLPRFAGGALHPIIQTGYAAEFGSDALFAQALAQTAVHSPDVLELFSPAPASEKPPTSLPLLEILRQVYASDILKPVMPYNPNASFNASIRDFRQEGRLEEIARLSSLWMGEQPNLDEKLEELFWFATLIAGGTSKPEHKPRIDFFLMHILNATLFLPSLLKIIPVAHKVIFLESFLREALFYLIIRGRPRIDATLIMSYTANVTPPNPTKLTPDKSTIGDPNDTSFTNPWPAILSEVIHAPDAHTLKAIRALYFFAQHYGQTPVGGVPGAVYGNEETHKGISKVDGTVFVRAAGFFMDFKGWVAHGEKENPWDYSGLGWDDAWKNES